MGQFLWHDCTFNKRPPGLIAPPSTSGLLTTENLPGQLGIRKAEHGSESLI